MPKVRCLAMGKLREPNRVKLITGLLSADTSFFPKVKKILEKKFGMVDFKSDETDFTHTDYYAKEMGSNLKRVFFSFERLLDLKDIYAVKRWTNRLEDEFLKSGKRTVNIDPGYLDLSKVILLSTKDYSHRIYLNKGIFAEVTLFYKNNSYNPWPWTYPDYRTKAYIDVFNHIRQIYKKANQGSAC